jgi:hypothetical protein
MTQALCTDCPPLAFASTIALHRPWWDRLASALLDGAQALLHRWQHDRDRARVEQALQALDARALRDLGFGEFASRRDAALRVEIERARW